MRYLLVRRFPKTRITREQKKNIFGLIKNEGKIVGGHLKLYFYTAEVGSHVPGTNLHWNKNLKMKSCRGT